MTRVLSIERTRGMNDGANIHRRPAGSAAAQRTALRLVTREDALQGIPQRRLWHRHRRITDRRSLMIDGVFITLTLGAAVTLWLIGW